MAMAGMGAMAGTAVLGFVPRRTAPQAGLLEMAALDRWPSAPRPPLMCMAGMAVTAAMPDRAVATVGTVVPVETVVPAETAGTAAAVVLHPIPVWQAMAVPAGTAALVARAELVA